MCISTLSLKTLSAFWLYLEPKWRLETRRHIKAALNQLAMGGSTTHCIFPKWRKHCGAISPLFLKLWFRTSLALWQLSKAVSAVVICRAERLHWQEAKKEVNFLCIIGQLTLTDAVEGLCDSAKPFSQFSEIQKVEANMQDNWNGTNKSSR